MFAKDAPRPHTIAMMRFERRTLEKRAFQKRHGAAAAVILCVVLINACGSDEQPMPETAADGDPKTRLIALAKADLAERRDLSLASINLKQFNAVTWRDGSLGCPAPGGLYTQALIEGFQLILSAGGADFYYHARATGEPFLCPAERRREPLGSHSTGNNDTVPL